MHLYIHEVWGLSFFFKRYTEYMWTFVLDELTGMNQSVKLVSDFVSDAAPDIGGGLETVLVEKGEIEEDPFEYFHFRQNAVFAALQRQKDSEGHRDRRARSLNRDTICFLMRQI